jgi:carbon storage regulator
MLVLTRKRSEVIQIGDDIVIKVIKTGRGAVKIGVEAPAHVRVLRGELCLDPPAAMQPPGTGEPDHDPRMLACSDQFPHVHEVA